MRYLKQCATISLLTDPPGTRGLGAKIFPSLVLPDRGTATSHTRHTTHTYTSGGVTPEKKQSKQQRTTLTRLGRFVHVLPWAVPVLPCQDPMAAGLSLPGSCTR